MRMTPSNCLSSTMAYTAFGLVRSRSAVSTTVSSNGDSTNLSVHEGASSVSRQSIMTFSHRTSPLLLLVNSCKHAVICFPRHLSDS